MILAHLGPPRKGSTATQRKRLFSKWLLQRSIHDGFNSRIIAVLMAGHLLDVYTPGIESLCGSFMAEKQMPIKIPANRPKTLTRRRRGPQWFFTLVGRTNGYENAAQKANKIHNPAIESLNCHVWCIEEWERMQTFAKKLQALQLVLDKFVGDHNLIPPRFCRHGDQILRCLYPLLCSRHWIGLHIIIAVEPRATES